MSYAHAHVTLYADKDCSSPYGRGIIGRWMAKAHAEVAAGNDELVAFR